MTTVHKGGLFGSDYRMLFPGDGVAGHQALLRGHADRVGQARASPASPPSWAWASAAPRTPACGSARKRRACALVGSRNPDPAAAALEDELTALGNYIGIGAMGFAGTSMVVATHVELAYTHTGGMPIGIHQFCLSSRRATARIHPDGRVEFRSDPRWFTDYYRRVGDRVMGVRSPRLDDVAMDEVHLTTPVSDEAIRSLKLGDVVYLSGALYTAREGVYRQVVDKGVPLPGGGARADQRELPLLARRGQRARTAPTWSRR